MEAESAPSDLIEQFCAITGADKGKAGFFLAAAGNDLNTAMNEYFASNSGSRQVGFNSSQDEDGQQKHIYKLTRFLHNSLHLHQALSLRHASTRSK